MSCSSKVSCGARQRTQAHCATREAAAHPRRCESADLRGGSQDYAWRNGGGLREKNRAGTVADNHSKPLLETAMQRRRPGYLSRRQDPAHPFN